MNTRRGTDSVGLDEDGHRITRAERHDHYDTS